VSGYREFLEAKARFSVSAGFPVADADVHPVLLGHQRHIVRWALAGGRRAIFASFGLGKTLIQLEVMRHLLNRTGLPVLIVLPLGVRQEFTRDAALLGVVPRFIRRDEEVDGAGVYLTNYESIRDGRLDPNLFAAASLDEASVLRSYGSKTYQTFLTLFDQVTYRFVATATPSPNRYKELIHYAGFLGVMDTDAEPDEHFLLWHDLEDERRAVKAALPDAVEVYGSLDLDIREQRVIDFAEGRSRLLATKPELSGSGCNFQRHCHRAVFLGVTWSFNDLIQAIHRIHRYQQPRPVRIDLIYAETEREVVRALQEKWTQHKELQRRMGELIREHGLSHASIEQALTRSLGIDRVEASGEGWLAVNNDCVLETEEMEPDSVDLIVTSIPFANHYEYTPTYEDFGHTDDNAHFWRQMDFLTPQLHRVLRPGRIYACHVKDRILFGSVTGAGVPTSSPFHAEAIFHGLKHGFDYLGMITVVTDVVRENNQTYRLGWSEMAKDGTKMGVGSPEYILLFHKPQTDRSKGYADVPVAHDKAAYTRARWQVDAHAFWRSSGQRHLTPDELAALPPDQLATVFTRETLQQVYDYDAHVRIGEELDGRGALPATFMALAPGSWHPDVWHDVARMLTLNTEQSRRAQAMHVCPLQFDIVDRLIERYSNPGELVFDPFAGLMTVPVRALAAGRRGRGVELNPGYFLDGVAYLQAEERKHDLPTLFDLAAS